MTSKETVKVCAVCKKRVSDNGRITFGGHVHNGWFQIHKHGGSTTFAALKAKRDWDVCSRKCLAKLVDTI